MEPPPAMTPAPADPADPIPPVAPATALENGHGSRIAIVALDAGDRVVVTVPGVAVELSEADGTLTLDAPGGKIIIDGSGIRLDTTGALTVTATAARLSVGEMAVDAGIVNFSGVVRCATLIADSVVAASYTPGAGNLS